MRWGWAVSGGGAAGSWSALSVSSPSRPVPFRYSMQHQPYPLNAACTSAPKHLHPLKIEQSSYSNYLQKYKKIIVIYLKYIYNGKNMS
jgi:hypothetical protein